MERFARTDRTKLKRLPERGSYDRDLVYQILDEGFVCHAGFAVDGQPFVIPTAYGRVGAKLYLHGSAASRAMRSLAGIRPPAYVTRYSRSAQTNSSISPT